VCSWTHTERRGEIEERRNCTIIGRHDGGDDRPEAQGAREGTDDGVEQGFSPVLLRGQHRSEDLCHVHSTALWDQAGVLHTNSRDRHECLLGVA